MIDLNKKSLHVDKRSNVSQSDVIVNSLGRLSWATLVLLDKSESVEERREQVPAMVIPERVNVADGPDAAKYVVVVEV